MALKLLVAAGLYPPDIGGPATYARMIEEQLPRNGIDVTVVPFGQVRHLPKFLRHLAFARELWRRADAHDGIYALDGVSVGLPAWIVARLKRRPLIVRLGGDYAWEQGSQRFGLRATLDEYTEHRRAASLPTRLLARVQDFVVARATRVIVPSHYLKRIVATWPHVREERLAVVYSALFPLRVEDSKEALRAQLGYQGFVIVSAGRLVPWKGFIPLLHTVHALRKVHPNVSLIIAGDGPEKERIEATIAALALGESVRLLGSLSKEALGATIKAADAFVLNTSYEGLSHQLLEVMDLEVPIVTTNVGGNPELIEEGATGLLVPHGDTAALTAAITLLIDNTTLQQRLMVKAKEKVVDFTQERVMVQLVATINQVFTERT